jgi:hypothetical protein
MKARGLVLLPALIAAAFRAPAQQPGFAKRADAHPPVETPAVLHDLSSLLPTKGLKHSGIVMDHIGGLRKLPGGTLGDYETGGKKYQVFLIDAGGNQAAAFLLLDAKADLTNPEYLASFGGYFGASADRPVFVFAKGRYLAGIVGLPKDQADPIARTLGARLR